MKKWFDFFKDDYSLINVVKNSSWLLSANIVALGIDFIHTLVIARWLGVKDYGMLALIVTYAVIINQLIDFRAGETVTKYVSEFWANNEKEKALSTIKLCYLIDISTGILAFLIVVSSSYYAAKYIIHSPDIYSLIILYSASLLFSTANGTSMAILRVFDKFRWLSTYFIATKLTKLVLVITFILLGYGITGVITAYILTELCGGIAVSVSAVSVIKNTLRTTEKAKISIIRDRLREIMKFLVNTNLNETATLFTTNIDVMLLGHFRNPTEVGFYRLAKNIVSLIGTIIDPFYQAIYPALSKMWISKQINEFKRLIYKVTLLMSCLVLPVIIFIFLFTPYIIEWTVGHSFISAVSSVRIMLLGISIASIFFWCRPALLALGKAGVLTAANIFGAVTMLALSFILIPKLGYIGTSLIYVYLYLVGHIIAFFSFLKLINIKYEYGVSK